MFMPSDSFTALLACGLEPNEKTTLFIQSDVFFSILFSGRTPIIVNCRGF